MPIPTLTSAPPAPARTQDSATFNSRTAAFLAYISGLPDELNAFAVDLAAEATAIAESAAAENASSAAADAAAAEDARDIAVAAAASVNPDNLVHRTGAESIAGAKTFSSAIVASAGVTINGQTLDGLTAAGVAVAEATDAEAQRVALGVSLTPTAKSTSYTILAADNGKLFDAEGLAAGITYTLPAASGVPADFHFWVRNPFYSGTAARPVTLAPNGTNKIDGTNASLKIYNETVLVVRTAAGDGWTVQKRAEVLCLEYTSNAAVASHEIGTPIDDTQFSEYRVELTATLTGAGTLNYRLGRGGTLLTTGVYEYSVATADGVGGTNNAAGNTGTATGIPSSGLSSVSSVHSITILNARSTAAGITGPRVMFRASQGAGISSVGAGSNASTTGLLTSFAVFAGFNFSTITARIYGIRKVA